MRYLQFISDSFQILTALFSIGIGCAEARFCRISQDELNGCVHLLLWTNILVHGIFNIIHGFYIFVLNIIRIYQRNSNETSINITLEGIKTPKIGLSVWSLVIYYSECNFLEFEFPHLWKMLEIEIIIFYIYCAFFLFLVIVILCMYCKIYKY